jgi:stage III sporulation protein AF
MIEFLSEWLRKIILLILLATFIDLLLPNSSMQRYVKLVIGLFVLLTILSPLFQVFHSEASPLSQLENGFSSKRTPEEEKSWKELQDQVQVIQQQQSEEVKQVVQVRVETEIRSMIESEYGYAVEQLQLQMEERNGAWGPAALQVELARGSPGEPPSADRGAETEPIREVEPVTITVGKEDQSSLPVFRPPDPHSEATKALVQSLHETWQIPKESIFIRWNVKEAASRHVGSD